MTKTLLRFYDKRDADSMTGRQYFLVLDGTWDDLSDYDLDVITNCITRMGWQNYTSYAVCTIDDLQDNELFLCEAMSYNMYECRVDVDRVSIAHKYKLPVWITGIED